MLDAKSRTITSLEERVKTLTTSLDAALGESREANAALQASEEAKTKLQSDLAEVLRRSDEVRHEYVEQTDQLEQARREVSSIVSDSEYALIDCAG